MPLGRPDLVALDGQAVSDLSAPVSPEKACPSRWLPTPGVRSPLPIRPIGCGPPADAGIEDPGATGLLRGSPEPSGLIPASMTAIRSSQMVRLLLRGAAIAFAASACWSCGTAPNSTQPGPGGD